MSVEVAKPVLSKDKERLQAKWLLYQLFLLSKGVYVESIQELGVSAEDAQRQIARLTEPTRLMMWAHIQAVMALNSDYAEEVRHKVETIGRVLGIGRNQVQ